MNNEDMKNFISQRNILVYGLKTEQKLRYFIPAFKIELDLFNIDLAGFQLLFNNFSLMDFPTKIHEDLFLYNDGQ
jgi:hypothetical protein